MMTSRVCITVVFFVRLWWPKMYFLYFHKHDCRMSSNFMEHYTIYKIPRSKILTCNSILFSFGFEMPSSLAIYFIPFGNGRHNFTPIHSFDAISIWEHQLFVIWSKCQRKWCTATFKQTNKTTERKSFVATMQLFNSGSVESTKNLCIHQCHRYLHTNVHIYFA